MFWQKNIAREVRSPALTWGHSGTPVIADGKVILQPGGAKAAVVALDVESGDVIGNLRAVRHRMHHSC